MTPKQREELESKLYTALQSMGELGILDPIAVIEILEDEYDLVPKGRMNCTDIMDAIVNIPLHGDVGEDTELYPNEASYLKLTTAIVEYLRGDMDAQR